VSLISPKINKFGSPVPPPIIESNLTAHDRKIIADNSRDLKYCLRWGGEEIGVYVPEPPDPIQKMPII